jgi:hypothetical protein
MNNVFRGEILPIDIFKKNNGMINIGTLLTAYSYEDRVVDSLQRSTQTFNIKRATILDYNVKDYLDTYTYTKWKKNRERMRKILQSKNIEINELSCRDDDTTTLPKDIETNIRTEERVLVDISSLTRNYLLHFARVLDSYLTLFLYTGRETRPLTDEEQSLSIRKIIPIDGFEGISHVERTDLVVLILGYEGNRALAFLNKFETNPVFALIGIPFSSDPKTEDIYKRGVTSANSKFLKVHRVARYEPFLHSLDPFAFAKELNDAITSFPKLQDYNVCISCLGTKMQTLGLYLYWKYNRTCQLLYSIPYKRLDISSSTGSSSIIRFD